jgi:hypothetical protein
MHDTTDDDGIAAATVNDAAAADNEGAYDERSPPWKHRYVMLDKNLLNFPLARDPRSRLDWLRTLAGWQADAGDNNISFVLPFGVDQALLHAPSPFDVNVLFALLAESARVKRREISFASRSALLRHMGLRPDCRSRVRLTASLAYWTQLSLRCSRWYFPAKSKAKRHHGRHTLAPPIVRWQQRDGELRIALNPAWLDKPKGYFEKVILQLPSDAAGQNLVLALMTSRPHPRRGDKIELRERDEVFDYTDRRALKGLYRKLGLSHRSRAAVLDHAIDSAARYYSRNGGGLLANIREGGVYFVIKLPLWTLQAERERPRPSGESRLNKERRLRRRAERRVDGLLEARRRDAAWMPDEIGPEGVDYWRTLHSQPVNRD